MVRVVIFFSNATSRGRGDRMARRAIYGDADPFLGYPRIDPVPGPETVRYGGNTSCVELRTDAGNVFVLDCGTGARALGRALLDERSGGERVLLFGHTHWDHIHGLPFFRRCSRPVNRGRCTVHEDWARRSRERLPGN